MDYNKKQRIYNTIMLVVLSITVTFIVTTVGLYKFWSSNPKQKFVMLPSAQSGVSADISRVKAIIDKYYLGDVDEQKLTDAAVKGYVSGLGDEYSEYITKEELSDFKSDITGNYNGVGIYYGRLKDSSEVVVITAIKDTPAYKAGIQPGDIITKINDEEISSEESLTSVANKIKGEVGSSVKLTIKRGEEVKEFNLTRENIQLHKVESKMLENNIGYINISSFDEETANQFKDEYSKLEKEGIKSLIIDLRNNGGGIVQEATDIADRILKKDLVILSTKDKNGEEEITKAKDDDSIDIPIIVLVNENSASASEILAGALKDNKVAQIVGTKTFGKGVIQSVFTLSNGSALKLTIEEYYTPSNTKINHVGITPDIEVKLPDDIENQYLIPEEQDTQLQKAIELLK